MAKMNVTEKDFEAFLQATESLMAISGSLDDRLQRRGLCNKQTVQKFQAKILKGKGGKKK